MAARYNWVSEQGVIQFFWSLVNMNSYLHVVASALLVSCGGGGENNASTGVEVDPYLGVWVSGCTSSIHATGTLPVYSDPNSFIETISITEESVSSTFEIYEDSDCNTLDEGLTALAQDFGGVLIDVQELTTDNGYPYRSYKTRNSVLNDSVTEVALVDGVLYRVYFDFAVFESSGEEQKNVIFEWNLTQQ